MTVRYSQAQIDSIASEVGNRIKNATTSSTIKTKYESNADTNAFTDAEKTKLSGIETGANLYTPPAYVYDTVTSNYTFQNSDFVGNVTKVVDTTVNGADITLTVPSTITNLAPVTIVRDGPFDVIITNGAGATVKSSDGRDRLRSDGSSASIFRSAASFFRLVGDVISL